jgi:F-type H+-transporting ATPase subunit epsilon
MPIELRVVSVERSLFEGEVDQVSSANGADGELGILPHHAPLLTALKPGQLRFVKEGKEELLFVGGGFLEVLPDRITVLASVAERADEIDESAAEAARKHAQDALAGVTTTSEEAELQTALAVAEARLRLARARKG